MPSTPTPPDSNSSPAKSSSSGKSWLPRWLVKLLLWSTGLLLAGVVSVLLFVAVALSVAYPNLPDISDLVDYRPKLPLRVFSADGVVIGEFGEERRSLTPIQDIPQVMKDAVLAIEDARFFSHGGVDYLGVIRAGFANVGRAKSQGASTITMQVARNVYLSAEKSYTRKIYEILLTFKLEHMLTKDQILEIYMNQIFLGNRAYGFAAASEAISASRSRTSPFPRRPCWPACPRRRRPTTLSSTPSAPGRDSSTSSSAWRKTASSRPSRPKPPRKSP